MGSVRRIDIVRAALARVRSSSALHERGPHWLFPEAALLWAVWVKAVMDHVGMSYYTLNGVDLSSARRTAMTGVVVKPNRKEVNALELLGIDPAWAFSQVTAALEYKEAA